MCNVLEPNSVYSAYWSTMESPIIIVNLFVCPKATDPGWRFRSALSKVPFLLSTHAIRRLRWEKDPGNKDRCGVLTRGRFLVYVPAWWGHKVIIFHGSVIRVRMEKVNEHSPHGIVDVSWMYRGCNTLVGRKRSSWSIPCSDKEYLPDPDAFMFFLKELFRHERLAIDPMFS